MNGETVTIRLTKEEREELLFFFAISRNYREEEQQACESLSKEKNEDGTVKYEKMKDNSECLKKMNEVIDVIENKVLCSKEEE